MKKKYIFSIILCTIFLLCACSNGGNSVKNKQYESASNRDTVSNDNEEDQSIDSDKKESKNENKKDCPSIWFDGVEFKILDYINDEYMLVKLMLDEYLIQTVVPRRLETVRYDSEFYVESYEGEKEVYLKLSSEDRTEAIFFSYGKGENLIQNYGDGSYESLKNVYGDELIEQKNKNGQFVYYGPAKLNIAISEYEMETNLSGYGVILPNIEQQTVFVFSILNENEKQCEKDIEPFLEIKYKKVDDSDLIRNTTLSEEEYTTRLDQMYSKYRDMAFTPDTYLREHGQADGEDYDYQYVIDMTNDGIPEVVFYGVFKSICIMGENNVVTFEGDEIYWSDEPNIFYVNISYPGEFIYSKCELLTDENGYISVNVIEPEYLKLFEYTDDYINYTTSYYGNGKEITEAEYQKVLSELQSVKHPKPRCYIDFIPGKNMFKQSAMRLTSDELQ